MFMLTSEPDVDNAMLKKEKPIRMMKEAIRQLGHNMHTCASDMLLNNEANIYACE